jgi:hypothetical protein
VRATDDCVGRARARTLTNQGLLRLTGCDLAQGYFIGRPMPAGELSAWHERWMERVARGEIGGAQSPHWR